MEINPEITVVFDPLAIPLERAWDRKFAQMVSRLFSPPVLICAGIFLAALAIDTAAGWLWSGFYLAVALLIPVAYIAWKVRRGELTDFHMRVREQRIKPMSLSLACAVLALAILAAAKAPAVLTIFAGVGVFQVAFLLLVTLRWKISGHSTAIAGWSLFMVALFGKFALPVLLLIPLVAWARVRLNRHELAQTIAGSAAGIAFILVTLYLVHLNGWKLSF